MIVLFTFNAKYIHSSLGLRCLKANLGPFSARTQLIEQTIQTRPEDAAEQILSHAPRIVGLGVYIWNTTQSLLLARLLKALAPDVILVVGGPEASHDIHLQDFADVADYTIAGEGELAFFELCRAVLEGTPPVASALASHVIRATPVDLQRVELPYELYDDDAVAHRVIYLESSRGCPYRCAFCLSALDRGVRWVPLARFFAAVDRLIDRGVRRFKLVDRTFNLDIPRAIEILEFFGDRSRQSPLFLHLELVPDRLPQPLYDALARFGPDNLQLEVGVQALDEATLERVDIRRNVAKLRVNLARLVALGVHLHTDLIAGLPGQDVAAFGRGFDELFALGVAEIQLGILKRLRGTPLASDRRFAALVFAQHPPYEILKSDSLEFDEVQKLKRVAQIWDRVGNSGNFSALLPQLPREGSLFAGLWELTGWLHAEHGQTHAIALDRLSELLLRFFAEVRGSPREQVRGLLASEYARAGRKLPKALRPQREPRISARRGPLEPTMASAKHPAEAAADRGPLSSALPPRQRNHRR